MSSVAAKTAERINMLPELEQIVETDKQTAFCEMMKLREESPFPQDFDWEKARAEAMLEKYGDIA